MVRANRKYVAPTQVLQSLVDDFGNRMLVGEQKDIGEFNLNFIERIEEGLGEKSILESDKVEEEEERKDFQVQRKSSSVFDSNQFVQSAQNSSKSNQNTIYSNFFGSKMTIIQIMKD